MSGISLVTTERTLAAWQKRFGPDCTVRHLRALVLVEQAGPDGADRHMLERELPMSSGSMTQLLHRFGTTTYNRNGEPGLGLVRFGAYQRNRYQPQTIWLTNKGRRWLADVLGTRP